MGANPPDVLYAVDGAIATITLNRTDRLNAFTRSMATRVIAALDAADADEAVRAVIITGAGRAFCAGKDLGDATPAPPPDQLAATDGKAPPFRDFGGVLSLRIHASLKPVIGAINGDAVGIGATMILPMDIRICAEQARFGYVFARRGIVPESASSWFLPRVVGISRALDWSITGRLVPAVEAREAGLVSAVVPADELLGRARDIAGQIASEAAPVSAALTRHLLWRSLGLAHPMESHRLESELLEARSNSSDPGEGFRSFMEKRKPDFPGRVPADLPAGFPWWDDPDF